MCQADVVMWLGKELQTQSACQLGMWLRCSVLKWFLSLSWKTRWGIFIFCNNTKLCSSDGLIHCTHCFPRVLLVCTIKWYKLGHTFLASFFPVLFLYWQFRVFGLWSGCGQDEEETTVWPLVLNHKWSGPRVGVCQFQSGNRQWWGKEVYLLAGTLHPLRRLCAMSLGPLSLHMLWAAMGIIGYLKGLLVGLQRTSGSQSSGGNTASSAR